MATKQFILELSRINSVRVQSEGEDADNKSNYTCIIPELDLKKNDIVQLDSSVINVRGADSQSIQFEGSYANNNNLIMDNIFMFEVGFYLNHNGINDVHLPFVYPGQTSGDIFKQKFITSKTTGDGDDEKIDLTYNMAKSQSYLTDGDVSDEYAARLPYVPADESNPNPELGVMNCNPFVKLNGRKYAQIARQWSGWMRNYDNNRLALTEPKLMTQEIPIEIPVGFNSPQAIADLITLNLQKTNPLFFDGNIIEDLTSATTNYYKLDAGILPNPTVRQYCLNGYCYKSTNANWTITGTDEFRNQAHLIYSNMATDEPYKWLYGTGILSRSETDPLSNYQWFNPNTFASQTAMDNLQLAYPCIIWNTLIGNNQEQKNLQNYSLYSPSEARVITGDQYSDDVIQVSELTGDYSIFNDFYRNVYTDNNGAYVYRQDNLYTIIKNDVATVTDDQGLQVKTALFVDQTDPNFTNLLAWNKYNILGGTWNRTSEQLVKKFNDVDEWHDGLEFSPSNASETGDFEPINNPFEGNGFIAIFTLLVGTLGDYYTYNWMTDNRIIEGEKYTLSFTTTHQGAFTPPYIHPIIVADRTADFGMSAMNITTDGDHSQTFTATASYTGSNAIMIGFRKQAPAGMVVKVSNISFLRDDTETDETYNVRDLNSVSDDEIDLVTFENNKLYSIQQNASIGTYDLALTGNTIPSQGAYIGVDYNRNYKVLVRGLIASYNGSEFVASNLLNGHDPNVCILYNDDDANYTYFIFKGYSHTDRWTIYRLSKYNGGIPQSGDVLGSIQSVGFNLKLGFRNGQQYYDFSQGNSWEYERASPDYSSGNTWGNTLTSPLQYTASYHYPALILNYDIYLKNNTYSGGSASYTYSFEDVEGVTVNGNEYDSIFTIDTNTGPIYYAYLLTNRVNGLSGSYEFNNSTSGNTWTIVTTGGHNGFGYIHFSGAFGTLLSPTTAWQVDNKVFNYDFDFDATPAGFTQDYLVSVDFQNNNLLSGTYMYFGSSNSFIAYQSIGTYTYDSGTRTISFFRRGTATIQNTLTTAITTINNIVVNTNYTNYVVNPLPTQVVGNPINETISYFGQISLHVSYGPNTLLLYFVVDSSIDKEGKSGYYYWNDSGTWHKQSWEWNGTNQITLRNLDGDVIITSTGSTPSLTNVFDYEVNQSVSDAGSIFAVPSNGQMYGSGYGAFGSTNYEQNIAQTLYLGPGLTNTDYSTTLDLHEGYCYNNQNDDWTNNNGLRWNYADGKISITRVSDSVKLSEYSKQGGENSIIKWGWIMARTDKNVDFNTEGSFFNPDVSINLQTIDQTPAEVEHVTLITIQNGEYDSRDLSGNPAGGGTLKIENIPDAYLDRSIAKIPKSTLIMTNIKFTMDNIKRIQNLFRYTEVYNGSETNRKNIINDVENYYVEMDLNWTDTDTLSTNDSNTTLNTSANKGVVMPYYYHYGQMGVDDSNDGGSEINEGVTFPRKKLNGHEQRMRIFTRWKDDPYTRTIYTNRVDWEYTFCRSYKQERLETELAEEYAYIKENNIGVIPMPMQFENGFCCCFEVYQDYTGEQLQTQQSLQFFGWSPSEFDHNYIIPLNADAPAIKDADYNYTGRQSDQMNFVNLGATNPTFSYNDNLNKFEVSNFHTNLQFNKESGTSTQEQDPYFEVRKQDVNFVDFMKDDSLYDSGRIIDGIADAQSGIYLNDVYFQFTKNRLITDVTDPNVVQANPTNFYGSALFRMGFSYYQFKPLNFYDKSFNNRFNNLFYNSLRSDFRKYSCRPFTTNALVNIASAPALNQFSQNTGRETTENPNTGTPIYGLGFNNNLSASVGATSDKLVAKSLTVNMKSPFFRIICPDLPLDTLIYSAQGQRLNSVGTCILNYSSANMFFYSYASSYQATITRDTTINSINVQFVDDTGNLVQGLDDRSSVTLKVLRNIQLDDEKDPVVEELKDIEDELEDLNKKEEIENTNDELERAGDTIGMGEGIGTGVREELESKTSDNVRVVSGEWWGNLQPRQRIKVLREDIGRAPTMKEIEDFGEELKQLPTRRRIQRIRDIARENNLEMPDFTIGDDLEEIPTRTRRERLDREGTERVSEEANRFIDSMLLAIIQNGLNFVGVRKRQTDNDFLGDVFSRGIIEYYLKNLPFINSMIDGLSREGINFLRDNRQLTQFLEQNNNIIMSPDGELIIDDPNASLSYQIGKDGAEVVLNKLNELFSNVNLKTDSSGNIKISSREERKIASQLKPTIINLLEAGGTIIPPRASTGGASKSGAGKETLGLRSRNYTEPQQDVLKRVLGNSLSDFLKNLGINVSETAERGRSPLGEQLLIRRNRNMYSVAREMLERNEGKDFRKTLGQLMKNIRNAGVRKINNNNLLSYLIGFRNMGNTSGQPLFVSGRDTAIRNFDFLPPGQEGEESRFNIGGGAEPSTPRKRRTKKEMAEARGMGEEDKPRPDARTKAQREKIKQEGAEESPLRTRGREILKEREEQEQ